MSFYTCNYTYKQKKKKHIQLYEPQVLIKRVPHLLQAINKTPAHCFITQYLYVSVFKTFTKLAQQLTRETYLTNVVV